MQGVYTCSSRSHWNPSLGAAQPPRDMQRDSQSLRLTSPCRPLHRGPHSRLNSLEQPVSHRLCFYLLQRSYFLIHLSLPSPFCMASRLTCLKPRLHYIPSFLGSETCPAFSAHDLSLSLSLTHTHTHTHQSLQGQQLLFLSAHDLTHTHTHTHSVFPRSTAAFSSLILISL